MRPGFAGGPPISDHHYDPSDDHHAFDDDHNPSSDHHDVPYDHDGIEADTSLVDRPGLDDHGRDDHCAGYNDG
jgi:hypothetical protein